MKYKVVATRFPLGFASSVLATKLSEELADFRNIFEGRYPEDPLFKLLSEGWNIHSFTVKDAPAGTEMAKAGDTLFFFLLEK